MMGHSPIGSLFADFLEEEGLTDAVEVSSVKKMLAWELRRTMEEQGISLAAMARQMQTSRTQVRRLLDPHNDQVRLDTLQRAARALGQRIVIDLVPVTEHASAGERIDEPARTAMAAR